MPARWDDLLAALDPEEPAALSDISLWEIATLSSLGRLDVTQPLGPWLASIVRSPRLRTHRVTARVAAEVAALPSTFHRDPADRIIVATARVLALPLMTADRRIVGSGLVEIV